MRISGFAALVAATSVCGVASAAIVEKVVYTAVDSVDILNNASNITKTYVSTAAAAYTNTRIAMAGRVTTKVTSTTANQARVAIKAGTNTSVSGFQPYSATSTTLGSYFSPYLGKYYDVSSFNTTPINPGDSYTLQFYESTNQTGVDATHSTIAFYFADGSTPTSTDLGTIAIGSSLSQSLTLAAGETKWLKLTLDSPVDASNFLQFDTNGATTLANADTQLALFNSSGTFAGVSEDISGSNFLSSIRFGDSAAGNIVSGAPTTLAAGTYYLAIQAYSDYNVIGDSYIFGSSATDTGSFTLNINSGFVPEPATTTLLALVGLPMLRRRR